MDEPDEVLPPETAGTGEPPMQKLPPAFVANMWKPGQAPNPYGKSGDRGRMVALKIHDDCVIALANSLRRDHTPAAPVRARWRRRWLGASKGRRGRWRRHKTACPDRAGGRIP
jgi:hypothetical protein